MVSVVECVVTCLPVIFISFGSVLIFFSNWVGMVTGIRSINSSELDFNSRVTYLGSVPTGLKKQYRYLSQLLTGSKKQ